MVPLTTLNALIDKRSRALVIANRPFAVQISREQQKLKKWIQEVLLHVEGIEKDIHNPSQLFDICHYLDTSADIPQEIAGQIIQMRNDVMESLLSAMYEENAVGKNRSEMLGLRREQAMARKLQSSLPLIRSQLLRTPDERFGPRWILKHYQNDLYDQARAYVYIDEKEEWSRFAVLLPSDLQERFDAKDCELDIPRTIESDEQARDLLMSIAHAEEMPLERLLDPTHLHDHRTKLSGFRLVYEYCDELVLLRTAQKESVTKSYVKPILQQEIHRRMDLALSAYAQKISNSTIKEKENVLRAISELANTCHEIITDNVSNAVELKKICAKLERACRESGLPKHLLESIKKMRFHQRSVLAIKAEWEREGPTDDKNQPTKTGVTTLNVMRSLVGLDVLYSLGSHEFITEGEKRAHQAILASLGEVALAEYKAAERPELYQFSDQSIDNLSAWIGEFETYRGLPVNDVPIPMLKDAKHKMLCELLFIAMRDRLFPSFCQGMGSVRSEITIMRSAMDSSESEASRKVRLDFYDRLEKFYSNCSKQECPATMKSEINGSPYPSPHQQVAMQESEEKRQLLIADEMGGGKTATAIAQFENLRLLGKAKKGLFILPTNVLPDWQKRLGEGCESYFREDMPRPKVVIISSEHPDRRTLWEEAAKDGTHYVLMPYSMLGRQAGKRQESSEEGEASEEAAEENAKMARSIGADFFCLDEAQMVKNPFGKSARRIRDISQSESIRKGYTTLLTGTPIPNKIRDIAMVLFLLHAGQGNIRNHIELPEELDFNDIEKVTRFVINNHTRVVRNLLLPSMLRRTSQNTIPITAEDASGKSYPLRKVSEEPTLGSLMPFEKAVYDAIMQDGDFNATSKINHLLNICRKGESKYRMIRASIDEHLAELTQTTIQTEGERLLLRSGAVVIRTKEREKIFRVTIGTETQNFRFLEGQWCRVTESGESAEGGTLGESQEHTEEFNTIFRDIQAIDASKEKPPAHSGKIVLITSGPAKGQTRDDHDNSHPESSLINTYHAGRLRQEYKELGIPVFILDGKKTGSDQLKGSTGELLWDDDGAPLTKTRSIIREFRLHEGPAILITRPDVAGVGISLTFASRMPFVSPLFTVPETDQQIARELRPGQKDFVWSQTLAIGSSIEEGVIQCGQDKWEVINKILLGRPLNAQERQRESEDEESKKIRRGGVLAYESQTDKQRMRELFNRLFSQGKHQAQKLFSMRNGHYGKDLARIYNESWEISYAGNVARLVTAILQNNMERTAGRPKVADIACGGLTMARMLPDAEVFSSDINEYMISKGREMIARQELVRRMSESGNFEEIDEAMTKDLSVEEIDALLAGRFREDQITVCPMDELPHPPYKRNEMQGAVLSLALDLTKHNRRSRFGMERVDTLRKLNQILAKDGIGVLTFPEGQFHSEADFMTFCSVMEQYFGLQPVLKFTNQFHSLDNDGQDQCSGWVLTVKKVQDPYYGDLPQHAWDALSFKRRPSGKNGKKIPRVIGPNTTPPQTGGSFHREFAIGESTLEFLSNDPSSTIAKEQQELDLQQLSDIQNTINQLTQEHGTIENIPAEKLMMIFVTQKSSKERSEPQPTPVFEGLLSEYGKADEIPDTILLAIPHEELIPNRSIRDDYAGALIRHYGGVQKIPQEEIDRINQSGIIVVHRECLKKKGAYICLVGRGIGKMGRARYFDKFALGGGINENEAANEKREEDSPPSD